MEFNSALDIGDVGWCTNCSGGIRPLTIGLVRVEKVDSPGRHGEDLFDNYKPQKGYKEEYMCVETGIKSGNLYTFGRNIFKTEAEAVKAVDDYNKEINRT